MFALDFKTTGHDPVPVFGIDGVKMKGYLVLIIINFSASDHVGNRLYWFTISGGQDQFNPNRFSLVDWLLEDRQQSGAADINGFPAQAPFLVLCQRRSCHQGSRHVNPKKITHLFMLDDFPANKAQGLIIDFFFYVCCQGDVLPFDIK